VQEIFGYCLEASDAWLHKAFVFFGEGRNGKSTLLKILENLVGKDNTSCVSLADIHKPFSCVSLFGKIVNIKEETPTDAINAEAFKNLVGGGNVIAAFKGKDEFYFPCQTKFIFACNRMPQFKDNSIALLDRLYFIDFNRYIKEQDRDRSVLNEILSKEMDGILFWSIEGLKRLLNRKYLLKHNNFNLIQSNYQLDTNSVFSFIQDELKFTEDKNHFITFRLLYEYYVDYCRRNNFALKSSRTFSRELHQILKNKDQISFLFKEIPENFDPNDFFKHRKDSKGLRFFLFANPQIEAHNLVG